MKRIIIDLSTLAEHPMEIGMKEGEGAYMERVGVALKEAGHDVHIRLGGYAEGWQGGISYWPKERGPKVADVLISTQRDVADQNRVKNVILADKVWDVQPYSEATNGIPKVPGRLIWTAGASRGLWHLMAMWPRLRERVPNVSITVAHNPAAYIDTMRWQHDFQGLFAQDLERWFQEPGVTALRRVEQKEVERARAEAVMFVYPCDPIMGSRYHRSLSGTEAAKAGCALLFSTEERLYQDFENVAAFMEQPWHHDDWAEVVADILTDDAKLAEWQAKAKAFADGCTWERFVSEWDAKVQEAA